jgi:hypothetical protein
MKAFELYRYTHTDGTAKEWGYSDLGNGQAEIRWGPENRLRGHQEKSLREARERARKKQREGYRQAGTAWLGETGSRVSPPSSRPTRRTPVDIAALLGGDDEGFYF